MHGPQEKYTFFSNPNIKKVVIPCFLFYLLNPFITMSQEIGENDEKIVQQFIQTRGTGTILFDASNIKQFWIDKSVVSKKGCFAIFLNGLQDFRSVPLKIQLANVNEWQDCKIEVITESSNVNFVVCDSRGRNLASSFEQESFIQYKIISSSFHIESISDLIFSLTFSSPSAAEINIKAILLSFSNNPDSSFLYPPGKLKINKDVLRVSATGNITQDDSTAFSLSGNNVSATGTKFIYLVDNTLSSSLKAKNIGQTPVKITLCFSSFNRKHERLDITSFPYRNSKQVFKVLHSEPNSDSIIIDSYPEVWGRYCYLALDAKEDMSDIPNKNLLEERIAEIVKTDNNQAEIRLNKPLTRQIRQGETIRLHAVGTSNITIQSKIIQPGEEVEIGGLFQKDSTFINDYSESFAKELFYIKPMILMESLESDKEASVIFSDFSISY